jgi:hypothetical protein
MRAYKILVGGPRHIWEDNIKTDLKEMAWERVDCSGQGCVGLHNIQGNSLTS